MGKSVLKRAITVLRFNSLHYLHYYQTLFITLIMNTNFKVEKPILHLNYFTIFIKYIVLFIVLFLSSWVAIPLLTVGKRGSRVNTVSSFMFENASVFAVLIAATIMGWFIYRTIKKYTFGEVFDINFDDSNRLLVLSQSILSIIKCRLKTISTAIFLLCSIKRKILCLVNKEFFIFII